MSGRRCDVVETRGRVAEMPSSAACMVSMLSVPLAGGAHACAHCSPMQIRTELLQTNIEADFNPHLIWTRKIHGADLIADETCPHLLARLRNALCGLPFSSSPHAVLPSACSVSSETS